MLEQETEKLQMVLDFAVEEAKVLIVDQVVAKMAMSRVEILRALTMLCELGLMTRAQMREGKETDRPIYHYELIKKIGAVHLASAAHLGLDTEALEKHRDVTKKEKKVAIDLAGKAEKMAELGPNKRKAIISRARSYWRPSAGDMVHENLMLIYEAANATLIEHIEKLAKQDIYMNTILSLHAEAEQALIQYAKDKR